MWLGVVSMLLIRSASGMMMITTQHMLAVAIMCTYFLAMLTAAMGFTTVSR
jgi:hypothetical protein